MSQKPNTSIKVYLERSIFKQSIIGFSAMALISVSVTFFLSRYKMSLDLQKAATSAAEAFRSRILEGDIKAVENQIHNVLGLRENEEAFVLDREQKPLYRSVHKENQAVPSCGAIGYTCFDSYSGPGRIFLPIYFDEKKENLFGYLYLSKSVQIDWLYVAMVFSVFSLGYLAVLLGLGSVAKASSRKLAVDVEEWARRLKNNPKSRDPLSKAPFAELSPLKDAIEGLTSQIEGYESHAEEKAKMLVLRGIAHDLLSPVSQVQLYLATLEQQMKFDASAEETLAEIKSSLQKVSMVASQVKTLKEVSESKRNLNLANIVKTEIVELQRSKAIASKNLRLNLEIQSDDVQSSLSETEVARILQNLVGNAADASADGSDINVTIAKFGNDSILTVEDKGHGIPEHLQQVVFEPDYTSKPSTGTGLGLFIVKHICEQKNGSVNLSSKRDFGTKVTVSVPILSQVVGGNHAT